MAVVNGDRQLRKHLQRGLPREFQEQIIALCRENKPAMDASGKITRPTLPMPEQAS